MNASELLKTHNKLNNPPAKRENYRERMKAAGYKRVQVWVPEWGIPRVVALSDRLRRGLPE